MQRVLSSIAARACMEYGGKGGRVIQHVLSSNAREQSE
jgi:hypothetical protein